MLKLSEKDVFNALVGALSAPAAPPILKKLEIPFYQREVRAQKLEDGAFRVELDKRYYRRYKRRYQPKLPPPTLDENVVRNAFNKVLPPSLVARTVTDAGEYVIMEVTLR